MKKNISEQTLDAILADKLLFKIPTKDICEKYSLSHSFVNCAVATYKAVGAADWGKIVFMLNGKQMTMNMVEWAAKKVGVSVPESLYAPKEEPKVEEPQLDGQTTFPEFNEIQLQFSKGANNTIHALIDALNKNTAEVTQLRKAVFALLNTAAVVE